ncbi:MAG TPA: type II toxin-antitoxin system VapC family toxin [Acidobacteriaceae bacterium]|nr:type II toxin-antitoxin system VapC family toxin [Acidobacteriaceae bacterium]
MKLIVDTNVLVRAVVQDDKKQAEAAARLLRRAETIAVSLPCLCEFVWVLRSVYGFGREEIAAAIRALLDAGNVVVNRPAADAGLAMLEANGDFADGVIAWEGRWLGGETFVSFDKQAVSLLGDLGVEARVV